MCVSGYSQGTRWVPSRLLSGLMLERWKALLYMWADVNWSVGRHLSHIDEVDHGASKGMIAIHKDDVTRTARTIAAQERWTHT